MCDTQQASCTADKELNNFKRGSPFYVIMYKSYKLLKTVLCCFCTTVYVH